MNVRNRYRRLTPRSLAARRRALRVETLEDRVLLSGVADAFGVKKIKYVEADGDKVQVKLKKDIFDITFDRDGIGDIVNVDTLTLYGNDPTAILSFKVKPAKGGLSDGITIVDLIDSAGPNVSLGGLESNGAVIHSLNLTGTLLGGFSTSTDFGSATFGHLTSFTIQGGHDLLGTLTVDSLDRFVANGGDIVGSLIVLTSLGELQADNISGTVTVGTSFDKLTLEGDLSGDVAFGKGTLEVLIGGNVTSTGSIVGNDPDNDTNIDAGGFSRLGVIGDFAGLFSADGDVGLGVGGALTSDVTAGNNLIARAGTLSGNLTATNGDVSFSMNSGGFSGVVTAADDVFGNGANNGIVIRGGNFDGVINAGDEVAAMTFLPASGGFAGSIVAGGKVNDITANFFASTTSITGASIGNLTANRTNAGDAIAAGATFTATNGAIGNVTARAIASIAIGGTFTADSIGNITATSNGNTSADHAISGATFLATEGAIGDVTATAKAGSGVHDSIFTATTGMGALSAVSNTRHGFEATADGLNVFTVTQGSFTSITGGSVLGDGIHGGTFTAFQDIDTVTGTSVSGSGIGDATGGVTAQFTAQEGIIREITGSATGGSAASGGDGIASSVFVSNSNADGVGIELIRGTSQFGSGMTSSRFSAEGDINAIEGTTNNSNPSVNEDGIFNSVFRTTGNIGTIVGTTGITGGAGVGSAIEGTIFSALGSIGTTTANIQNAAVQSNLLAQEPVPNASTNTLRVDNDVPEGTVGHWDVDVQSGGESRDAQLTAQRFASGDVVTENVLFDYFSYVDVGNDGGGVQLSGADPETVGGDADRVRSTGTLTGSAGNTINWEVVSYIEDGGSIYYNEIKFTAQTGTLGTLRFLQYLDEDIEGVSDDVLLVRGSAAEGDLELFTIDNDEVYGVSHGGSLNSEQGLVNATFAGWAADEYDDMRPRITGSGETVSPEGEIDEASLQLFNHPQLGDVYGPRDIVSVFAWDVTPSATSATIITTLGGVPDASALNEAAITTTGDVLNSQFLAGYDVAADFELDGTAGDASEIAATTPVEIGKIQVTGDWINSFATAGITTTDATFGNGDDALSAPGSQINEISVSSNIAGVAGNPAPRYFLSDAIGDIDADAIGIDPNSGSTPAAVGFYTAFSNVEVGSIGDIAANTSSQLQAIGDGTEFRSATTIGNITAVNDNPSFFPVNAIGAATFEAGTSIGNITVETNFTPLGVTLLNATFTAHANNASTHLAIGNIDINTEATSSPTALVGTTFDASSPTVAGEALNIGTVTVVGNLGIIDLAAANDALFANHFLATGDIARGVRMPSATQVTNADMNGDGNADLIVVNEAAHSVAVALGNGDGTFAAPTVLSVGDSPVRVVVTDLTGDAALDLVVLNSVSDLKADDTISVVINNGDGTFAAPTEISLGTQSTPTGLAVGDWIEDGKPDLAITDIDGSVQILKGLGGGDFEEAAVTDLVTGGAPSSVTVTSATGAALPPPLSFNADGRIDMAVTNFDDDSISIFLGNVSAVTGTWTAPSTFSVGDGPAALAIGSLDSTVNNRLDIVVANQFSNNVSVLLGDGAGGFGAASNLAVGTNPVAVALADLNNDGRADIITANSGTNDVSVLLGDGFGGFAAPATFAVGANPASLTTADFDGDGAIDLAVANKDSDSLTVLFGDGDGLFERRNIFTDPSVTGIKVTGVIRSGSFIADSDGNATGSLAGIGGITVIPGPTAAEDGPQGIIFAFSVPTVFSAGSNDDTSGLAIGDVEVQGANWMDGDLVIATAIDSTEFVATATGGLNIGAIETLLGSLGAGSISSVGGLFPTLTATGDIHDLTIAASLGDGTTVIADSDIDGDGDIHSVSANSISVLSLTGNNVAVADDDNDRAITAITAANDLTVTALTGSIGDLRVGQSSDAPGEGAAGLTFDAADSIGDILVLFSNPDETTFREALASSSFRAAQSVATGRMGDIVVENAVANNPFNALTDSTFVAGTGGMGDITVTSVGDGSAGVVNSSFRTTGTPDVDHRGNIGNITIEVVSTTDNPVNAAFQSVFSAIGSIGRGTGNENGYNLELAGVSTSSRFLAGYDIGEDLTAGTGDDVVSSSVSFINKTLFGGRFLASDLAAGVDPGNGVFGDSDDMAAVVGSSLGSIEVAGVADAESEPGEGGFVPQNPLADRLHGIVSDLIGSILIADEQQVANLPGYIDNGGVADVNIRVL